MNPAVNVQPAHEPAQRPNKLVKLLLTRLAIMSVTVSFEDIIAVNTQLLSLGQTLSTFHYTLLDKCRALLSVVERGWPNALDFSLDLELNIPLMYCLNK